CEVIIVPGSPMAELLGFRVFVFNLQNRSRPREPCLACSASSRGQSASPRPTPQELNGSKRVRIRIGLCDGVSRPGWLPPVGTTHKLLYCFPEHRGRRHTSRQVYLEHGAGLVQWQPAATSWPPRGCLRWSSHCHRNGSRRGHQD